MAPVRNSQVLYKSIPEGAHAPMTLCSPDRGAGYPVPGETLVADHSARIDLDTVPLPPGAVLAKTLVLSLDPYLRGKMAAAGKTTSGVRPSCPSRAVTLIGSAGAL